MKPNPVFALVAAGLARAAARRPAWPRRRRRRALVVAVALFALLAGASRAAAAVTAKFNDSTDTVLVNMTATGDVASVWREGDAIRVNGPVTGAPTVTSADVVVFDDNPDLDSTVIVDLRGGPFSPGQGWEATTPEIEFTQQLDTGLDRLRVLVADTGGGLAVGTGGLNLDPEEGTPADLEFQSLAAAGTSVRAKLKLTRRGKALLKRRRLRAKLHVTVAGGAPATRTVRLRRTGRSRP